MLRALWNSKSAMMATQDKLDSISNNLSNINTQGYKKIDVKFKDLVYETLNRQGYPISENNNRAQEPFTGGGVKASGFIRDFKQGPLKDTGKSTDMAIDGEGFFRVIKPDGTYAYTRDGSFNIDPKLGKIVDGAGNVLDVKYNDGIDKENLTLEASNLYINSKGGISLQQGDKRVDIGTITLYSPLGDNGLMSIGDNYYVPMEGTQMLDATDYDIRQGFVEMSNVDMVSEFTDLMLTQRAFELGSRGIKTADEMWGMINNLRGK